MRKPTHPVSGSRLLLELENQTLQISIPGLTMLEDLFVQNMKSGKLTSWGNGSLSTIIYRVFTHPRWLFGISSINSISKKWMNFGAPLLIWGGVCQVIGAIQRRQQKLFPTMNHREIGPTYSFCDTPRSKKIQSLLKLYTVVYNQKKLLLYIILLV